MRSEGSRVARAPVSTQITISAVYQERTRAQRRPRLLGEGVDACIAEVVHAALVDVHTCAATAVFCELDLGGDRAARCVEFNRAVSALRGIHIDSLKTILRNGAGVIDGLIRLASHVSGARLTFDPNFRDLFVLLLNLQVETCWTAIAVLIAAASGEEN